MGGSRRKDMAIVWRAAVTGRARRQRPWRPIGSMGLMGLVGLVDFFCFYSINRGGQKTAFENASLTVTFAQRWLALPASENQFQPSLKKFL